MVLPMTRRRAMGVCAIIAIAAVAATAYELRRPRPAPQSPGDPDEEVTNEEEDGVPVNQGAPD